MQGLNETGEVFKKISPQDMKDMYDRDTLGYYLFFSLEQASLDIEFRVKDYWLRRGLPFLSLCKIIPQILDTDPLLIMSEDKWDGLSAVIKRYEHYLSLLDVAFDISKDAENGLSVIEQEFHISDNDVGKQMMRTLYSVHDYFNDYFGEYTNSHEEITFIHRILNLYRKSDRDKS